MKKILFLILFLSGMMFSQELTGDNPYKAQFKKDPLNYRSLPMVFYRASDTTYWSPVHADGILTVGLPTVTDTSLGALIVSVNNQPQFHYTNAEILVDSTDATVNSAYTHYNVASYDRSTIAVNFDDSTTARFYSSIYAAPDFTDETSGDWGDITFAVVGADSVDYGTNTNWYITEALSPNEWILIKYTKRGDTNSIKIGVKKKGN